MQMSIEADSRVAIKNIESRPSGDGTGAGSVLCWEWPPFLDDLKINAACIITADKDNPDMQLKDLLEQNMSLRFCTRAEYDINNCWTVPQSEDVLLFRVFAMCFDQKRDGQGGDYRVIYDQLPDSNRSPKIYKRRKLEYSVKYERFGRFRNAKITFADESAAAKCQEKAFVYEKFACENHVKDKALAGVYMFSHKAYLGNAERFCLLVGKDESIRLAINPQMPDLKNATTLTEIDRPFGFGHRRK
jgi:hypothetical protein